MTGGTRFAAIAAALALGALPTGCTYDYLQHTDQVSYSAGNAVRANLAMETINPWKRDMYDTRGLGKNGIVVPQTTSTSTSTGASKSMTSASTGLGTP
jgi:hypothetical protein